MSHGLSLYGSNTVTANGASGSGVVESNAAAGSMADSKLRLSNFQSTKSNKELSQAMSNAESNQPRNSRLSDDQQPQLS